MPAPDPCTCQKVTSILFQVSVYLQVALSLYPLTACTPPLLGVKLSISGSCRHACVPLSPTLIDNPSNWSQSGGNQTIMAWRLLFNHLWLIAMLKIIRVLATSTFYIKKKYLQEKRFPCSVNWFCPPSVDKTRHDGKVTAEITSTLSVQAAAPPWEIVQRARQ